MCIMFLLEKLKDLGVLSPRKAEDYKKAWYKFSRNPLSVAGLVIVIVVVALAILAPYVTPYPHHAEYYVDFANANQPPSLAHPFGTDQFGRDVLTRIIFGFRYSLMMAATVLAIVTPPGVILGLIAGYYRDRWIDTVIMRIADIFVAVPPLVLALSICAVLEPNIFNAMMAVSLMWWPWYTRLVYSMASSLRMEPFVQAAEIIGASKIHIMFKEILPNCLGAILTKVTLDAAWVIILGSALSFVGLGAQPPTPDLGTMLSDGAKYMPTIWWITVFPAIAIVVIVLGFNLLGDGIRDVYAAEAR